MFDAFLGYLITLVGLLVLANATLGRALGRHIPQRWVGSATVTLVGEVATALFVLGIGLGFLTQSVAAVVPLCLAGGITSAVSHWRTDRRHRASEKKQREENARLYPGVFDRIPPHDPQDVAAEVFDLYDNDMCVYLGRASRADLIALTHEWENLADRGKNDIYLFEEFVEALPDGRVAPELKALLMAGARTRHVMTLRWLPA